MRSSPRRSSAEARRAELSRAEPTALAAHAAGGGGRVRSGGRLCVAGRGPHAALGASGASAAVNGAETARGDGGGKEQSFGSRPPAAASS